MKHIEELHNLYKVLESAREERGGISFESEEAKFIFNAERRIERIEQTQRNDAHKLIEECMIRRTSPPRASLRRRRSRRCSVSMISQPPKRLPPSVPCWLSWDWSCGGNKPEPRDYAELLTSIADRPDAEMLQTMLLRSMKQAVYDPENRGHFGRRCSHTPTSPRRFVVTRTCRCTALSSICWPKSRDIKATAPRPAAGTTAWKRCSSWVSTVR